MTNPNPSPVDLADTARQLARQRDRWRPLVDFDPVTRFYARIDVTADYEAWLLTWLPGQGTDWHDHGSSAGSFVVVQGRLTEEIGTGPGRAARRGRPRSALSAGDQRSFGRHHVHRVANVDIDPAVSLHVYAPKLTVMRTYVEEDGVLRPAEEQRVGVSW